MNYINKNDNLVDLVHKMNEKNPSEIKQKELLSKQSKKPENYIVLKNGTVAEMGNKNEGKVVVKE